MSKKLCVVVTVSEMTFAVQHVLDSDPRAAAIFADPRLMEGFVQFVLHQLTPFANLAVGAQDGMLQCDHAYFAIAHFLADLMAFTPENSPQGSVPMSLASPAHSGSFNEVFPDSMSEHDCEDELPVVEHATLGILTQQHSAAADPALLPWNGGLESETPFVPTVLLLESAANAADA